MYKSNGQTRNRLVHAAVKNIVKCIINYVSWTEPKK